MERVDGYRVLGRLGRGGSGTVYRAFDEIRGREVALKVLDAGADEEDRRRFLREARLAATLSHPAIARCLEAGESGETRYIVFELLLGETLRARVRRGPLPAPSVVAIGRAIADGLAHAHARGVLHRDLKPDNVILGPGDAPRILDFGLARGVRAEVLSGAALELRDTTIDTASGRVLGTPGYMAPEQVRGERVDERADLHALGVILYELCTGVLPYPGEPVARIVATTRSPPASPRSLAPTLPEALEGLILRCLAKDPDARPPSAEAVRAELERIAGAGARRRRRTLQGAALAAGLTLVSAAGLWLLLRAASGTREPAPPAPTPSATTTRLPAPLVVKDLRVSPAAPAPPPAAVPSSRAATAAATATRPPAASTVSRARAAHPAVGDTLVDPFGR